MAENDPPADPPTDPPADPPTPPATDDVEKLKTALQKANKEAERSRLKLKELEDAGKSELQKALDEKAAAEQSRDQAQRELRRAQIARKHGLDDDDMEFVSGSTDEEIEASAVKLAGRILRNAGDPPKDPPAGDDPPKPPPTQRPAEQLRGGGDPTTPPEETDPAKLAAAIPR